ncbi:hypothetical protein HMPREF1486_05617 [Streptomyces sp. HPH0547]|nr:hypothetical protein HMPREF1486_05617 [Streptomyces sp. HPH0547]
MLTRVPQQFVQPEELRDNMSPDAEALWALVRPHTGEQHSVRPTTHGHGSDVTALVEGEYGPVFVKACRNRPGGRRASIVRERLVNPSVRALSPELRWHVEDDEWIALGFEVVEGRSADFGPDSGDLGVVVGLLDGLQEVSPPAEAADWQETRWDRFAPEGSSETFRGDTLLFTDVNPDNFVIGEHRSWIVDWSWPTRGAGFIDPACLVVQLIAAGHTAGMAEEWAARCKGWVSAAPAAIDAFAMATLRMNERQAERFPEARWLGDMVEAAHRWAEHRGVAEGTGTRPQ